MLIKWGKYQSQLFRIRRMFFIKNKRENGFCLKNEQRIFLILELYPVDQNQNHIRMLFENKHPMFQICFIQALNRRNQLDFPLKFGTIILVDIRSRN